MEITEKLLIELQNRLKVGSRRGVHLNAIPARSRYKFDLTRLSHIDENLPNNFINSLLTELPLKFKISWKDNVPDLNSLFEEDQTQLVKITKSFENLINQTDAIESEKGLNTFGFGFPLLIRRDQSDNKLTVAPILIWSLRIRRTKEFNTWEILRNEDDPIYINEVLINHLQNDSKIEIDQISREHLDDGLIDRNELLEICVNIIEAINSTTPNDLRDTFEKKLDEIKSIPEKKYYEKLPLTSNNSFIDFGGLFSIFEVQKQNIIYDYGNLLELKGATIDLEDMDKHFFQPISSVETDPSQQGILHSLKTSRNILIQGPPGTGKSQSLTAILVNALENQKKTIVVCEKRTALEVLYNALNKKGLNYQSILIKDIIKDRRLAVDSVRDRVDNSSYRRYRYTHSKETLDNIIQKSKALIDAINKRHQKLDRKLIGNKNWTSVVGSLLSELKDNSEKSNLDLAKDTFSYESSELNRLLELIRKGQNLNNEYKLHKDLSFLNSSKLIGDNPFIIEQQIQDDFLYYKKELEDIGEQVLLYEQDFYNIRKKQLNQQEEKIHKISNPLLKIFSKYEKADDFYDEEKTKSFIYKAVSIFSKTKKTIINDQFKVNTSYAEIQNTTKASKDLETIVYAKTIDDKELSLEIYKSIIESTKKDFQSKIETEFESIDILQPLAGEFENELLLSIKSQITSLKIKILEDNWSTVDLSQTSYKSIVEAVEQLIESKESFFGNENDLFSIEFKWFQYYNSLPTEDALIIDQLIEKEDWRKTFLIFYLNSMLVNSANMDLPTNDNDHVELGKSLSELEKEQIKYIREYWFSKQIDATRDFDNRNPDIAVENLYNKRASNKHKRLSLREIVKLDMDLFTTFFPIILTTPDVASNLFKGQNQYFDIVMFDEASQLKLEDNLPALLKGKQIVIAGDEHQMPPSNYFSKIFDGTIDDEDKFEEEEDRIRNTLGNSMLDCESLLDFAAILGFEKKHLDFHYRSRHPYLIDYSNYAFYNQRLKPLPNSFDYIPINYVPVNGTYSDNSNDAEAETVLSIIDNNISLLPDGNYPTVGVATFNINQRNLILGKINERRKFERFRDFNEKIVELEENGFFVKNLENIQGDERDVIILSTTYGINKEGKFAQRFGSINHQKGYKLLNVIITRAKYKVYVCSSIPLEVFMNYKEHLITEGSNNRRGAFYAYLAYAKAVSDQDNEARISVLNTLAENSTKSRSIDNFNEDLESPFEEEVYEALTKHFDESKIIPQLQFAGFRIDIVYDTEHIGLPKIAIECDGAEYHSSQEAYLHDRHRQKILEGHGFVFHRIWSTNWWRNPQKETQKLVDFIRKIENSNPSVFEDKSRTGLAFTDNITIIEHEIAKVAPSLQKDLKETIKAVTQNEDFQTELFKETIDLNSKVKVKYLNIDKDLKVHLVEHTVSKAEKSNGIQKINIKSPLGAALKGKAVGDTVKIGDLDKYVRILEILN
ncbi:AAA domain-containing protein [Kriegella aquimaris]|uniref:Superfamily I DNA and/or RNA helicase n=1 Tax=Kriegella aquimaris TaxID=192904 RepID=A0A1G9YTM9_9FLAO|nr:GreA/GreB family elongation factor [Kriegella aquimaris]SDN11861.1 Superfamily I DNA and/or RNA helicase [Kriegella aquimaris]